MFYLVVGLAAAFSMIFMILWGGSIEEKLDKIDTNLKRIADALEQKH